MVYTVQLSRNDVPFQGILSLFFGGQLGYNTTRFPYCQYTFFKFLLSFSGFCFRSFCVVFSLFPCHYILWYDC